MSASPSESHFIHPAESQTAVTTPISYEVLVHENSAPEHALPQNDIPHSAQHPDRLPLRTRLAAGALAAIGVLTFIGGSAKESSATSNKEQPTAEAESQSPTKQESKKGILPVVSKVMYPTSDDPTQLATAQYNNFASYLNTGKDIFLEYQLVNLDSEVANKEREGYQEDQVYRSQAHKGFHRTYSITKATAETPFSPNDTQRVILVKYVENEYLDNRAHTPIYRKTPGYVRLTLVPVEKDVPTAKGNTEKKTVWLQSYAEYLGMPPASESAATHHAF